MALPGPRMSASGILPSSFLSSYSSFIPLASLPFLSLPLSSLPSLSFPISSTPSWLSVRQSNRDPQNKAATAQVQCYRLPREEHWTLTFISSIGQMEDVISHPLESLGMRESEKATATVVGVGWGGDPIPIQSTKQQLLGPV